MAEQIEHGKTDKLWRVLALCWLLTVFTSFFNSYFLSVSLPVVGTLFPFRIMLPITAVLYFIWVIKNREPIWRGTSALEKWCYILVAILLLYGAVSLLRAMDFSWSFRRLFNLCFDLCFFFLMLRLCRNKQLLKATLMVLFVMLAVISLLGIYEVFFGGIVNDAYDDFKRLYVFNGLFQYPIVFSGNTNDYATTLIFLYVVLLLAVLRKGIEIRKREYVWIVLMGTVVYFLALAGDSRLCEACFFLLVVGMFLYFLLCQKRRIRIAVLLILGILCVEFIVQYRYIVPPIQQYLSEVQAYQAEQTDTPESVSAEPVPSENADHEVQQPTLVLGDQGKQTLEEQFFDTDEETGEKALRDEGSAGIRVHLLLHAFDCIKESYGLGVGLGNTETLAAQRGVVPEWADKPQNSIHCFLARLGADYGIFALVPLCVIAFLLLKRIVQLLVYGIRSRNRNHVAYAVLFFFCIVIYPILSTASSDAQDIIPMWIYLAGMVLYAVNFPAQDSLKKEV